MSCMWIQGPQASMVCAWNHYEKEEGQDLPTTVPPLVPQEVGMVMGWNRMRIN